MPAKNSIKEYVEDGIYHLYNRGVEKRDVFLDDQDFSVYLSYLKTYLLPKDTIGLHAILSSNEATNQEKDKAAKLLHLNNYSETIDLLGYALIPNHFHFLIKQTEANSINSFISALSTRYVLYFNRKYHRVGPLYQGVYKAVLVNSDEQLLHLSRYIHLNPGKNPWPSSLPEYLNERKTAWVKPKLVLDYFSKEAGNNSYASFMAENQEGEILSSCALDLNDE